MARSCPTTLSTLAAYCEPCYCDRCDGAAKLLGEPCEFCGELQWGCRNMLCPCVLSGWVPRSRLCACGQPRQDPAQELCADCWLFDFRQKFRGASSFQALWRGYSERKKLREKNAMEIGVALPNWRKLDEQYKMFALCQTIYVKLKEDEEGWDPTTTLYYEWMMNYGPLLEEYEDWMRVRGWKRPKRTYFHIPRFAELLNDVLKECGFATLGPRVVEIITEELINLR